MRTLLYIYGSLRGLFNLPRYIPVEWHFDSGTSWMVYDSYEQVYVSGTICRDKASAISKIANINQGILNG